MLGMKLGLVPALGIYQGADPLWSWTPAQLFTGGRAGLWLGGVNPADLRLWEDSTATTRSLLAGQPVGRADRAVGSVGVAQATSLSRPTLARMPAGGRIRNLLRMTDDLTTAAWSRQSCILTTSGLMTATGAAGTMVYPVVRTAQSFRAKAGDVITVSATVWKDTAGANPTDYFTLEFPTAVTNTTGRSAIFNIATGVVQGVAPTATAGIVALGSGKFRCWVSITVQADWMPNIYANYFLGTYATQLVGTTAYIEDPQIEIGSGGMTPYQPTDDTGFPQRGHGSIRNLVPCSGRITGADCWTVLNAAGGTGNLSVTSATINGRIVPAITLDNSTGTGEARAVSGTIDTAQDGWIYSAYVASNAGNVKLRTALGDYPTKTKGADWSRISVTRSEKSAESYGTADQLWVVAAAGQVVSFALPQFEIATTPTAPQLVNHRLDVTEPGKADLWYLSNDGGDSLPASLPAGSYQVAALDCYGRIRTESVTLASAGTIDALRNPQLRDAVVVAGSWATGEEAALTAYWERIAA